MFPEMKLIADMSASYGFRGSCPSFHPSRPLTDEQRQGQNGRDPRSGRNRFCAGRQERGRKQNVTERGGATDIQEATIQRLSIFSGYINPERSSSRPGKRTSDADGWIGIQVGLIDLADDRLGNTRGSSSSNTDVSATVIITAGFRESCGTRHLGSGHLLYDTLAATRRTKICPWPQ